MEVFTSTKKLGKELNSPRLLKKTYGKEKANRIMFRLCELQQAKTLSEVPSTPPINCHQLHGDMADKFVVSVSKNYRIIFKGYDKNDQQTQVRSQVVTVQIEEIADYH